MSANKTRQTESSVAAFVEAIEDETKRADAKAIVDLMKTVSGEEPKMWGPSIIGFGSRHYAYDSGREGDMPLVAFSPRKAATVLYIALLFGGSKPLFERLGKFTTGKGCLYIKKLSDVNEAVLKEILAKAVAAARAK